MAQKLKARKLIVILAFVSFCILIIPTVIYLGNFGGYKLSDSPGDWGVFGDYLGGVLNPLLSIVNLIVLGYLTVFVSEQDNRMALNQFRFDFYMELKEKLTNLDKDSEVTDLDKLITQIEYFGDFDFLFSQKTLYQNKMNQMKAILDKIKIGTRELSGGRKIRHLQNAEHKTKIYNEITEYDKAQKKLLLFIQSEIVGQ